MISFRGFAILLAACLIVGPTVANGSIVFSNDFEDGDLNPELGSWAFGTTDRINSVIATGGDATLGNNVGLLDQANPIGSALDLQLNFGDATNDYACLDLTNGNCVTLSFDVIARRTTGFAKTARIQAVDIDGNTVMEFVLGDSNAFGNGGSDRQRPGMRTSSGSTAFADDFYWGADSNPGNGLDTTRDARFEITIKEDHWDLAGTRQTGAQDLNQTNLDTWTGGSFTNIAAFTIITEGGNSGFYIDNLTVDADAPVLAGGHVPEPGSAALLAMFALGMVGRRNRRS